MLTVLTVSFSIGFGNYIGIYAEKEHCLAAQALMAAEDPTAITHCTVVQTPVPIPPPRPANLKKHQPVPIPPPRPWG